MEHDEILDISNGLGIRLSNDMVARILDDGEACESLCRTLSYTSRINEKDKGRSNKIMRSSLLGALYLSGAWKEPIDIENADVRESVSELKRLPYLRPGELNLYVYGSCKAMPYYASILFSRFKNIIPEEDAKRCIALMERLSSHPRYFRAMDHELKMTEARPVISALSRLKDAGLEDDAKDDLVIALCILLFNIIPSPGLIRYMGGLKPADSTLGYELSAMLAVNYLLMGDAANAGQYASRALKCASTDEKKAYVSLLIGCIRITEGRSAEAASILEQFTGTTPDIRIWSTVQFYLGIIHYELGDPGKAIDRFKNAMPGMVEDVDIMGSCVNAAACAMTLCDPDTAIVYMAEALDAGKLTEGNTSKALKSAAFGSLGIAYYNKKDYAKALDNFRRALALCKDLRDKKGIADQLANIGLTFKHMRDYASALDYFKSALSYASGTGYTEAVLFAIGQVEQVLSLTGGYEEADVIRQETIRRHPHVSGLLSK